MSLKAPDKFPAQAYKFAALKDMGESMQVNKAAFKNLFYLARRFDFKVALLLVPELKNQAEIDEWIQKDCPREYGFGTINLLSAFKARLINLEDLRIVPQGLCHFNTTGHEITAEIIKTWINKELVF